jgi:hypothetical protein
MNNKEGNNKKKAVLDQRVLDLAQIAKTCDAKKGTRAKKVK